MNFGVFIMAYGDPVICRKYLYMQNILGLGNFENADILENMVIIPPKYNRSWGTDYILMDSKNFMSGKGEADYSQIVDMYQKIWDAYNYRLFSVL